MFSEQSVQKAETGWKKVCCLRACDHLESPLIYMIMLTRAYHDRLCKSLSHFFLLFLLAIWGKSRDGKCERMSLGIFQIETQLGDSQIRNFERCFVKEYLHIRNCRANDATQQFKDLRWPHCSVVAVDWLAEGVNRLFTLCKSPIDTEKGNHRRMLN